MASSPTAKKSKKNTPGCMGLLFSRRQMMASSPTAKKSKKNTPGCMGRFLNFFDFHRHRHGRKLQTHKKYSDGTEAPRNSLDVGVETPQCVETKVETKVMPEEYMAATHRKCYPNVSTSEDEWKICKQINDRNNEEPIQTSDLILNDDNITEGSEKESASFNDSEMPYSEIPDSNQNFEEFDKVEIETSSLPTSSESEMESKRNEQSNATSGTGPTEVVVCPTAVGEEMNDDNITEGSERESASFNDSEMPYSEIPDSNQNFEEFDKVEIETSSLPMSSESEMESKRNEQSNATSETGPTEVVVCPTAVGGEIDLALELVKGIPCPKERLDDLLSIRNILVSGGLATNDCAYSSKQHSAVQNMHASMYQRIEECYNESTLQKVVDGSEGSEGSSDDHLVFDCINETLLEILKPYCHPRPWISQNVSNIIYMPSGKKLLEKIWAKVCSSLYPEADTQVELNSLLANDLGNAGWLEFQDENEEIGNDIAQFILDNLIEDLARDLVDTGAFSQ